MRFGVLDVGGNAAQLQVVAFNDSADSAIVTALPNRLGDGMLGRAGDGTR
jgi:hypothetical protein